MYNYEFLDILIYKKIESLKDDPWKLATYVCGGLMDNDDHNPDYQSCEECALNAICHSNKDKLPAENLADWLLDTHPSFEDPDSRRYIPAFVFDSTNRSLEIVSRIMNKGIFESLDGEEQ